MPQDVNIFPNYLSLTPLSVDSGPDLPIDVKEKDQFLVKLLPTLYH